MLFALLTKNETLTSEGLINTALNIKLKQMLTFKALALLHLSILGLEFKKE